MSNTIDVQLLRRMFLCGAQNLEANKEWINELNVFPGPDGDTGTNMGMTVVSAVREVLTVDDADDMKKVCKAISSGSLRGARGNSGVILSQLLRGFCKTVRDHSELDVALCADGFEKAVETAYKAVMKPKEGTILTVAKGAAEKARELADSGVTEFDEFIPAVAAYAEEVLAKTPDMLPVLKQAGVVDSGGQGLLQLLKGAYEGYQGVPFDESKLFGTQDSAEGASEQEKKAAQEDLRYGYVVTFEDVFTKPYNDKIDRDTAAYMRTIADGIVTERGEKSMRIQLHTNDPGLVLQKALMYGQLRGISIANLRLGEAYEKMTVADAQKAAENARDSAAGMPAETEKVHKEIGMIAVCAGEGLAEIFRGLGVDYVISGGQTMNPSTEDILNAVDQVDADTVFILPNNKNIILASNQAAAISDNKKIVVIPTKTVPQGITAAINFIPDQDAALNEQTMTEEIRKVRSAEVTYAVRDTVIENTRIHEGNIMVIGDDGILAVGESKNASTMDALSGMVSDSTELVSIYYGEDATEEEADDLRKMVAEAYPHVDVEVQAGGQPVYYYILSAE